MRTDTNRQWTTYRILDATIVEADIADDAVTTPKILDDAVTTPKILDDAVTTPKILDDAVTGAKLPDDAVGYFETATEVVVAFSDFGASPIELLALDASNDRLIMVQAIATISAEGAPEWDVGSETLDTDAAFDDIGSGVWVAGERWTGFCLLPANQALDCTLTTAGTAGAIKFRTVVLIPKVQTAQIADDAVTGAKIADDAVDSEHIAGDAIEGEHVADEAIDSEHIANYAIVLRHLASDLVFALALGEEELKEVRANEKYGYANVEER